jgi:hypothetical protein
MSEFALRATSQNCWVKSRCINPNGQITHHSPRYPHYPQTESIHIISLSCISFLSHDYPETLTLIPSAGQECPTSSGAIYASRIHISVTPDHRLVTGIPMGLGAGFKLKDKEKELISPVDSEPDLASIPYGWTAILEDWLSHAGGSNLESSTAMEGIIP